MNSTTPRTSEATTSLGEANDLYEQELRRRLQSQGIDAPSGVDIQELISLGLTEQDRESSDQEQPVVDELKPLGTVNGTVNEPKPSLEVGFTLDPGYGSEAPMGGMWIEPYTLAPIMACGDVFGPAERERLSALRADTEGEEAPAMLELEFRLETSQG